MARNTYGGPADTGRLAIKAPQNGPAISAATDADSTSNAVVTARMRGGNQIAVVIGYEVPPARRVIQAARRQDSAAGCQAEMLACLCANERDEPLFVKP